jgi:peptide/nickel transport system permease protein
MTAVGVSRTALTKWAPPKAFRTPIVVFGFTVIAFWVVVGVLAPIIAPADPLAPTANLFQAPSLHHLFGTDELGRDVLSRVLFGARVSLPLSVMLVAVSLILGGALGATAAYVGGWVDSIVMRLTDLVLAVPAILLAMGVVGALGPGLFHAVIALVFVSWPRNARVVRSLVRTTLNSEYVSVSRLIGASTPRTLVVDILPNIAGPMIVLAALDVGTAILLLSGLSFLGLGAQPPSAEWGSMVSEGAQHFESWWIGAFPGLAIVSIVLAFNYLGDGLRDALDPKAIVGDAKPS